MLEGLFHVTKPSHPEDDDTPPTMPTTQDELAQVVHRRWANHRKWVKK